ncbi:hypothetical protein OJE16_14530 [Pantoea tagorei]
MRNITALLAGLLALFALPANAADLSAQLTGFFSGSRRAACCGHDGRD